MGICDSEGVINDFAIPFHPTVNIKFKRLTWKEDDFAFGKPTKYLVLDPKKIKSDSDCIEEWNKGIKDGREKYKSYWVMDIWVI